MQFKLWCLPILLLINFSNGAGFMSARDGMYVSTQAEEEQRYRENPNPQKKYRVTINIENAPGEFKELYTYANYQSTNCQYLKKGFAGATDQPYHTIHLDSKKISETQYQTEFSVDGMLDEDYDYGNGICKWQLNNVSIIFKATGAKDETRFSASIDGDELDKKYFEKNHFKKYYPKDNSLPEHLQREGFSHLSQGIIRDINRFKPEEYFTFSVDLEEIK